ncbi:MAG: hypothetical protein WCO84_01475 [bacterium]
MYNSNCVYCGEKYIQKNKNQKFCCIKCKQLYYKEKREDILYICDYCGKHYTSLNKKREKIIFVQKYVNLKIKNK